MGSPQFLFVFVFLLVLGRFMGVVRLNFWFEINQTCKIVSQMRICIDEYVVQFSKITKE